MRGTMICRSMRTSTVHICAYMMASDNNKNSLVYSQLQRVQLARGLRRS